MDNIETYLFTGRENAIHQKDLAIILGVTPDRVKKMVKDARDNGSKIISGTEGYWLPKDNEELKHFYFMIRKQAITRLETIRQIRPIIQDVGGQIDLDDYLRSYLNDTTKEQECEQERKKE